MNENEQIKKVATAMASLGHAARLSVYRLLVRAGHDGLNVGEIGDQLDLPASTLSHHLRALVQAGLVIQEKRGREIFNRPDFDAMEYLTAFLTKECCSGVAPRVNVA
ncbi:MAG: metalloregulator ArsR/SmtB family transcription factor [Sulfitobacter sp.]